MKPTEGEVEIMVMMSSQSQWHSKQMGWRSTLYIRAGQRVCDRVPPSVEDIIITTTHTYIHIHIRVHTINKATDCTFVH